MSAPLHAAPAHLPFDPFCPGSTLVHYEQTVRGRVGRLWVEGAAAQTWGFHRKPEAMPNAPRCSPHLATWRNVLAQGATRLTHELASTLPSTAVASMAGAYTRPPFGST